jgi:polynucleotide 5'-kinase 3'-phosphatase
MGKFELKGHNLLFWKPSSKHISSKLLAIDLDHTFIKPKSGAILPKDLDDWKLCYEDLSAIEKYQADDYSIIFMTNQKIINTPYKLESFKHKWQAILEFMKSNYPQINVNTWGLIAALISDIYRKPSIGMWNFAIAEYNDGMNYSLESSLFVGDAAGRTTDFSPADIMFSMNVGCKYMLPEVFFTGEKVKKLQSDYLIASIQKNTKYFNPVKFIAEYNQNPPPIIPDLTELRACRLVIMVGAQASGKSTFCKKYMADYKYMNNDTFSGTTAKFRKTVEKLLSAGNSVVIDNTNPSAEGRAKWLELSKLYKIQCGVAYMTATENRLYVEHMFRLRNILEIQTVPSIALRVFYKKFQKPSHLEGFQSICEIPLILDFDVITLKQFQWWME